MSKKIALNNPDIIYENIRKYRSMLGLSQENIATELGITQKHYSRIERGETEISFKMLCKIADILGIKVQYLIGLEEMLIFHNINQPNRDGHFYAYNATDVEELKKLYNALLKEKDETIKALKEMIEELKKRK